MTRIDSDLWTYRIGTAIVVLVTLTALVLL